MGSFQGMGQAQTGFFKISVATDDSKKMKPQAIAKEPPVKTAPEVIVGKDMSKAASDTDRSIDIQEKGVKFREPAQPGSNGSAIVSESIDIEREYAEARKVVGRDIADDHISDDSDYQDDDDDASVGEMPEKLKGLDPSMAFNASLR